MSKVIARKDGGFKIVCMFPDICKTPVGPATPPIPYPVVSFLSNAKKVISTIRMNGDPVFVYDKSFVSNTIGDQPGILKGIKSNKVGAKCYPKSHSSNVKAKGKYVVRLGDTFWMNG